MLLISVEEFELDIERSVDLDGATVARREREAVRRGDRADQGVVDGPTCDAEVSQPVEKIGRVGG